MNGQTMLTAGVRGGPTDSARRPNILGASTRAATSSYIGRSHPARRSIKGSLRADEVLNMKSSIADEGAAAQTLGREPPAETLAPMRPGQSRRQSEAAGLSRLRVLHLGK